VNMTTKAASPAAAAPVTATAAANNEMTENIAYMTLMHELKAAFPNLSDDAVKQCVLENGPDRDRCVAALTSELDNANSVVTATSSSSTPPPPPSSSAPSMRRYSLQALLSHQMEQRLNLERTLRDEREKLNSMRVDVREMEHKVNQKMLVRLGPLNMRQGDVMKNTDAIERDIGVLRNTCDEMADEVTKITKGAVPLGETSIAFYESLISENGGAPAFAGSGDGETPTPTTTTTPGRTSPPPRPPPPRQPARTAPPPPAASSSSEEGPQWSCSECTFLNHPALDKCEQCEMARVGLGGTTASSDVENRTSDCFCHPSTTAAAASRQQLQQFMSVEPPTQPSSRSSNSNRAGISKSFSVDHPPHNFNS